MMHFSPTASFLLALALCWCYSPVNGLAWNARSVIRSKPPILATKILDKEVEDTSKGPRTAKNLKDGAPPYYGERQGPLFIEDRRSILYKIALYGASGVTSVCWNAQEASAVQSKSLPPLDNRAPDFELPNTQGQTVTLDRLTSAKKWTVLYFYPGAFTSGCTLEARGFQKDMGTYKKLNAQIVGVSVDSVEKNAQFCSTEELDYYMLSDLNGSVSKKYGSALSIPGIGTFSNRQTYIIDPTGSLRWVFLDVESHVGRHSQEVIEKLTELQQQ